MINEFTQIYELEELINLVEKDRGISHGVVLTGENLPDGIPTLRAGDLQKFHVKLDNVKKIDPEIEKKCQRTKLSGGELLLRIRGGVGKVAICPVEMIGGNVSREIAVIPFTDQVFSKYAMYALASPIYQTKMVNKLRGTSYVGINLKDVRQLSIPTPPLSEQKRIVEYLDRLQSKIETMKKEREKALEETDALLPSILDKAFKGEL